MELELSFFPVLVDELGRLRKDLKMACIKVLVFDFSPHHTGVLKRNFPIFEIRSLACELLPLVLENGPSAIVPMSERC